MTDVRQAGRLLRLHGYGAPAWTDRKLYCFTHAGGAAPFYRSWLSRLPDGMELRAVQLPGRQDLLNAPVFTRMEPLARAVADAVTDDARGLPFAFFGHSMGALTAFETARELRRRGAPQPVLIGLSGFRAPHLPHALEGMGALSDREFLDRLGEHGGIPREMQEFPELVELALPALRADFAVLESYAHQYEPPLDCPFSVFGGLDDRLASLAELDAWRRHTGGKVTVEQLPGDHFFLASWSSHVIAALVATDLG